MCFKLIMRLPSLADFCLKTLSVDKRTNVSLSRYQNFRLKALKGHCVISEKNLKLKIVIFTVMQTLFFLWVNKQAVQLCLKLERWQVNKDSLFFSFVYAEKISQWRTFSLSSKLRSAPLKKQNDTWSHDRREKKSHSIIDLTTHTWYRKGHWTQTNTCN